jgi:predicted permease
VEREIDEELQFHVDERMRALTAEGLSREAAAARIARQFGSQVRLREQSRDVRLLPWLDSLGRDVRLGARMLRRNALVTTAAIVSLSLALGACIAAFSLVDALILRPLPVRQPERLIYLDFPGPNPDVSDNAFSDPAFVRLRDAGRGLVDLFAVGYPDRSRVTFDLASGDRETVRAQVVSGDAFERLGVAPAAGRLLTMEDDRQPGAHPVAILSHAFWMQRFGGDRGIVGRWFVLHNNNRDDQQFQIVGVTAPRFTGIEPGRSVDVWLPYAMQNPYAFGNAGYSAIRVLGRMKDDARPEQVQSALQVSFTHFRREFAPKPVGPDGSPERVARFINTPLHVQSAATGPSPLRARFQRPLWMLTVIAALVLLIAGSNVANLFLARTAAREREMSLRLSLGAGRGRLIQQMLIESALVAGAACLIGLIFAAVAAPTVVGMLTSTDDPVSLDLGVNGQLAAAISGMTLLLTAICGLAPALRASSVAPMTALKAGGGRTAARAGAVRPFLAAQVAFSLIVLFVGGLLVRSFVKLSNVNPGFATSDVLLVSWEPIQRMEWNEQRLALLQVLDRLRDVPGVAAVSAAEFTALDRTWRNNVSVPGREAIEATMAPVAPGYFETMQIPLLAGRTFVRRDLETEFPTVVVVNESFAKRYFGGEPAVGRLVGVRFGRTDAPKEVLGVVADVRYDLRKPPAPTIYLLLPIQSHRTLHVRVAGDATTIAARLRDDVRAAAPLFRVTSVTSQTATVARTLVRERLLALLSGFFALVGLVLTAVGLYGVLSYAVVQRTREIGIRVALGARALGAVRSVLADTASTTLIGAVCGLAGGLYASRFVETLLFEVAARDVWSLALPLGTLLLAAFVAAVVPAWRATRVDPVIALRHE